MDKSTFQHCKICGPDKHYVSEDEFHSHLKTHKISRESYYTTYFPRRDLLTDEPIPFKNKEHYFSHSFLSKENLSAWLTSQPAEVQREFCKSCLVERKARKGILYSPSQVETRSVMMPAVSYMEKVFDYYSLCSELGLINKYRHCDNLLSHNVFFGEKIIFVDTREQKPLRFTWDSEPKKLDYGDYAFVNEAWTGKCHIERKSATDFIGTLGIGLDRFKREIERAGEDSASLIIVVEESLSLILKFNELLDLPDSIRATPEYIFNNVRELIQKYPFIQFLFVHGRSKAASAITKIFEYGNLHINYDLQCMYDKGFF